MMDGSGGGKGPLGFRLKWWLAENVNNPWFIAHASLIMMGVMVVVLWLALQDFKEKIAAINPEAFESCIDQMERLQPEVGTKYMTINCNPDGSLSVTAVYAQ